MRFIPTCVENMKVWTGSWQTTSVHPHMRGEYALRERYPFMDAGSSPHAWRISFGIKCMMPYLRFIPTCVENIATINKMSYVATVHPHMRGEYFSVLLLASMPRGSSPHAWRIFRRCLLRVGRVRFIPTCVENMSCGWGRSSAGCGSSPHAWRIFRRRGAIVVEDRFIPTCVENIPKPRVPTPRAPVHPHMRGEYLSVGVSGVIVHGSSPHAWRIFSPIPYPLPLTSVHPHMRGEYACNGDV